MLAAVLHLLTGLMTPHGAAHLAAHLVGEPAMASELVRICHRESVGPARRLPGTCKALRVHRGDAGHSRRVWERAASRGLIRPWCQPYRPGQWSTRGSWGLMAAYNLRWLGIPCLPPEALDSPLLGAIAAANKLKAHCEKPPHKRLPSTSSWGRCDWRVEIFDGDGDGIHDGKPLWMADICANAMNHDSKDCVQWRLERVSTIDVNGVRK